MNPTKVPVIPPEKLDSWKEIAAFIGRDVRTAIRWAKQQGMPVHRVPGAKRSRVYGSRSEITSWLEGRPHDPPSVTSGAEKRRSKVTWFWAVGIVASAILALIAWRGHADSQVLPARVDVAGNTVRLFDSKGRTLWSYRLAHAVEPSLFPHDKDAAYFMRIADLRGDGDREVLLVEPYRLGPNPDDMVGVEVDCFSSRGALLWRYIPDESFQFGTHELNGPWKVYDLLLSDDGPKPSIWVAIIHNVWGNSFVVQLDPATGRHTVRFVNTGIIHKLRELQTSHIRYLLIGGFNNEWDGGSLAIMDERKPFAASPQTPGTRHVCMSCPVGAPDYYLVFPRSEINQFEKMYENSVFLIDINHDEVQVSKLETDSDPQGVRTIFLFGIDSHIEPVSLRYDSGYDMLHRELSAKGELDHSLDQCPERLHPRPVRLWMPSKGWAELAFASASASR